VVVRKRGSKWEYDFRLLGKRHRDGGFRTKTIAELAEKKKERELLSGKQMTYAEVWEKFLEGTKHKPLTREKYVWLYDFYLKESLGPLYLTEFETATFDDLKKRFDPTLGASTVNLYLTLAKAPLTFAWKRNWMPHPPWVAKDPTPDKVEQWYTVEERDRFLEGVFEHAPHWYLFFYLTSRLGLRRGEVYPIEHEQFQRERGSLLIDKGAVQGTKDRPLQIDLRKGNDTLTLKVTQDVFDAYDWHCKMGFAGKRYVMMPNDKVPTYLDSHKAVMRTVQKRLGLPRYPHHAIGRHSVASQAVEDEQHPKAIQQQLGHKRAETTQRYMHAKQGAQLKIVEALRPSRAPHEVDPQALN
jgi:integrase